METVAYYLVAEHRFAVASNLDTLWTQMTNYEPFLVDKGDVLFTMYVEPNSQLTPLARHSYQHVFTDLSDTDMPRIEVYKGERQEHGWLMRISMVAHSAICCELVCDEQFTRGTLHIAEDCRDVRFCIDNALMLLFAFRTAPLMTLEMHAAVVVKTTIPYSHDTNNCLGYLFLGHSGTGKSTHAQQWLLAFSDAWLLNDDNPILRVMDNGEIRVYGSPWSGKTPCYKNQYAPVGGIVQLSQAPHNHMQTISLPQAYAYMLSSASGLKIDQQMADYMYNSIKHIITHVPCRHLDCLPNTDAALVCWRELAGGN